MKYIILLFAALFSACYVENYQLFETAYDKDLKVEAERIVYENNEAKVSYDFWGDGGRMSFRFYNKTNQVLYLNVEQCYFIKNGLASSYYQAETTTKETGSVLILRPYTTGITQTYKEQTSKMLTTIAVPVESFVIVGTKVIAPLLYLDCNLDQEPNNNSSSSLVFNEENSPLFFRNYITYSTEKDFKETKTIDNKFWVSKIENMKENQFAKSGDGRDCKGNYVSTTIYKDRRPGNFFLSYSYNPNSQ